MSEEIHYKETLHGFEYGAAKVNRQASHKGGVWVTIDTPHKGLVVYVSPKGRVLRAWEEGA